LTVTTTEAKGLGPAPALAEDLASQGSDASPHLAARNIRDAAHLADIGLGMPQAWTVSPSWQVTRPSRPVPSPMH
jgi:methylenetetrahydrofolate reductase (NADPH)